MTQEVNREVAAKRRKDAFGLTTRERQVLVLRVQQPEMNWADIARLLQVSRFRVTEIKRNLTAKGMLTPEKAAVSKKGREVVDATLVDTNDAAGAS